MIICVVRTNITWVFLLFIIQMHKWQISSDVRLVFKYYLP